MNRKFKFIVVLALVTLFDEISGHGYLLDPVNRASRWRVDGSSPKDYNDMESDCGGYYVQWGTTYAGKCGHCGDEYGDSTPRAHELGGTYGLGVIMEGYTSGATIDVTVKLTANHQGYFFFQLCNLDDEIESDDCFDRHRLSIASGNETYMLPSTSAGNYVVSLNLPADLTCDHCVLQWTYVCGNNWGSGITTLAGTGICESGESGGRLGCGKQEHFRTCSDIRITK